MPIKSCSLKIALAFSFTSLSSATLKMICSRHDTVPSFEPTAFLYFCTTSFYTPSINVHGLQVLYISKGLHHDIGFKVYHTTTLWDCLGQRSINTTHWSRLDFRRVMLWLQFTTRCYSCACTRHTLISLFSYLLD